MIRVLLVDDHAMVRAGLAGLIAGADDLEVVGEASDGAMAVRLAEELRPDVVLMDLSMPVMDGVAATTAVRRVCPDAQVVVLTSFSDDARVRQALAAGASGYLLKDSDPGVLLAAVRSAALGDAPLDPKVARILLTAMRVEQPTSVLSGREQEVLALVAKGLANKQIGRRLGIAERTVKAHLGKVFKTIGVTDRTSAALWARDHLPGPG